MLNPESVAAVASARFGSHFVRPLYDSYGFARIPATVEQLLSGRGDQPLPAAALAGLDPRYETVVLLLIDAFGWRFFGPRAASHPLTRRFLDAGVVSRLTTQFPSTTAAHVTALHTGQPPAASGVYEWFIYEPGVNRMIAPLLYAFAGENERDGLLDQQPDPAALFPTDTLYRRLAAAGVRSTVFHSYARSAYTSAVCAGAELVGFRTVAEGLATLSERLQAQQGPEYFMLYIDTVDTVCHLHGPDSTQTDAEIEAVLTAIERILHPTLAARGRPGLLLLTADHGQIATDPTRTLMVDQLVPGLRAATPRGADGRPLLPGGSNRDLFLFVEQSQREPIAAELASALAGRAEVHMAADLVAAGLFGPEPSPTFLARLGDIVVLPFAGETVWWDERRFPIRFRGMHGGLTPEEAHTQLAALGY